jgi:hypothetical protein|tara:strand:- start:60 stop:335 length:276 start_codon:yes stop_codon:yes gene_type:complete
MTHKDKEVTYVTADCLEQSVNLLKVLGNEYGWEDNKEYIRQTFILSTIGYVITHDEYKEELLIFFKKLGIKIKENREIIKQAKHYADNKRK